MHAYMYACMCVCIYVCIAGTVRAAGFLSETRMHKASVRATRPSRATIRRLQHWAGKPCSTSPRECDLMMEGSTIANLPRKDFDADMVQLWITLSDKCLECKICSGAKKEREERDEGRRTRLLQRHLPEGGSRVPHVVGAV